MVTFTVNVYTPLHRRMVLYNLAAGRFTQRNVVADFIRLKLNSAMAERPRDA